MGTVSKAVALLLALAPPHSAIQLGGLASLAAGGGAPAPTEPGCYLRKLKGCPRHPKFNSSGWKLAEAAEKLRGAKLNRTACEVDAKADMMRFCNSTSIEALFVPSAADDEAAPSAPGCFVRNVKGCPKHPQYNGTHWKEAEKFRQAASQNRTFCEIDVKASMARWCGTESIETRFVPPGAGPAAPAPAAADAPAALPTEPGCYTRKMACPNHPSFVSASWKHAKNSERDSGAGSNRTFCEVVVKAQLTKYCGSEQLEVLFVAPKDVWTHDAAIDQAKSDAVGSEGGIEGLSTLAIGREPGEGAENASHEVPTEPGCYIRKVRGCPRHPEFNGTAWAHAANAERHGGAAENRTACEVDARENTLRWCGTEDVEVLFVPPRLAPAAAEGEPAAAAAAAPAEEAGAGAGAGGEERPEPLEGANESDRLPTEPGCYVRAPGGCPNHPRFGSLRWEHDEHAERFFAKRERNMCEVLRRQHLTTWCGTDSIEMLFVPSGPEAAAEAGGADAVGQSPVERTDTGSASIASGSLVEKKPPPPAAAAEGGAGGAGAGAPPPPREAPARPGCYVRTPAGCPKHPDFYSATWKHEGYGENHTGARTNRTTCEVVRKRNLAAWCGVPEVQMRFVPPATAGAAAASLPAPAQ